MVGRITFPPKKQPGGPQTSEDSSLPPSYSDIHRSEHPHSFYTQTMTTTVTTTTQTMHTTAHFFSLPLWRRRAGPVISGTVSDSDGIHAFNAFNVSEDGKLARASTYNVDKDLPAVPIPQDDATCSPLDGTQRGISEQPSTVSSSDADPTEHNGSSAKSSSSRKSSLTLSPSQPTRVLAHAALGLGLPHVMPLAAPSNPDLNSAAGPSSSASQSNPNVRRSRSFFVSRTDETQPLSHLQRRGHNARRSISLMGEDTNIANLKGKGKEGEREIVEADEDVLPTKPLSRRPSFWQRRRVQSLKTPPPEPSDGLSRNTLQSPIPSLPFLPPVSPMFAESELQSSPITDSPATTPPLTGRLRRRHSERNTSSSSTRTSSLDTIPIPDPPPIPKRSPHRPMSPPSMARSSTVPGTSDPIRIPPAISPRPSTAGQATPSALSNLSPLINDSRRRPRSATNPPNILHRLSMGFFTSSSPSPLSSPTVSTNVIDYKPNSDSPRTSATFLRSSLSKSTGEIPRPREENESPEVFLSRLEEAVSKAEIANVLAGRSVQYNLFSLAIVLYDTKVEIPSISDLYNYTLTASILQTMRLISHCVSC